MKILVIGATGLVGSAVVARLAVEGHEIVAIARHPPATGTAPVTWLRFDIGKAARTDDWTGILSRIDAVVNCVGVLQDGPGETTAAVHASAPAALFRACESCGVRRVVHLSAVGVDRETPTAFSRAKREGDEALMARDL